MKPIILIAEDKILRITERLALTLKCDFSIRGNSVSGLPESVAQGSNNVSILRRASSPHLRKLAMVQIMPTVPITTDQKMSDAEGCRITNIANILRTCIDEFDFFTTALNLMQQHVNDTAAAAEDKAQNEASGRKPNLGGKEVSLKNSIYNDLRDRWAASGILGLAAAAALVDRDISDPENACSFLKIYDEWDNSAGTSLINSNLASMFIGAKDGGSMPTDIKLGASDFFQYLEYVQLTTAPDPKRSLNVGRLMQVLSGTAKPGDIETESDLYTRLTVLNAIKSAPKMAVILRDSIDLSSDRYSDQKELDLLLHEASRVKSLCAARLFASLQGWIALMQMAMRPFVQPLFMEYMKSRLPQTSAVYDVDGLINKFMGLNVGEFTVDLIGSDMQVTSATYAGKDYPVFHACGQSMKAEETWGVVAGLYKTLIPNLHTLMSHSKLWEVYEEGARLLGSKPLPVTSKRIDMEGTKVAFVQMGVNKGDVLSDMDDVHLSAVFEWGVNKFNSSARTLVRFNDSDSETMIPPYNYGQIDYQAYLSERFIEVGKLIAARKGVSGHRISSMNLPVFPMRKRRIMDSVRGIVYDRSLLDKGPSSMLPVQPLGMVSIAKAFTPVTVRKQKIGSYETRLDNLEFEFLHAEPYSGATKEKNLSSSSFLAEALGLSRAIVDTMITANANVLNRFLSPTDRNSLACKAISVDKLFIDQANCFFYIPGTTLFPEMSLIDIMPEFMDTDPDKMWHSTRAMKLGYRRILAPTDKAPSFASMLNQIMGRVSGTALYLDSAFGLPTGQDDMIDWFSITG